MQAEQPGVGVDAQLVGQLGPQLGVGGQRVGLAAAPVEREHPQAAQPLPEGVLAGQPVQLAGHAGVPPAGQVGLDPVLESGEPGLLQPRYVGLREGQVGDVAQRRAAPQRQGSRHPGGRRGRPAARSARALAARPAKRSASSWPGSSWSR